MARLDLDGRTLGEFTLREKIGEGGFAAVHRAEQPALGREAVVKVLHARLATTPEVAQRFLREARLASRIDHPYAAHVYAFGAEADGLLWIAMELVRGTPMDKLLEQGPLTLEQLVPLFERICEVVQNAHDHGIVHRDLKPGNVMVMTRGTRLLPKLLDFGIARALDDVEPDEPVAAPPPSDRPIDPRATTAWVEVERDGTRRGQVMGSPSYMAPEQWIDAGSVGPATDIYALGVLAFQALSGRVPYSGTIADVRASHLEATPPALGAKFPPAVDALLARALAKKPLERYESATELAVAMRAAAGFEDGALPQLAPAIREAALASVQPIAEAVAALDGARNLDQGAAMIGGVAAVATRWLAMVALAARTSIGAGGETDSEPVRERLRQLGRGRLDDAGWFALACELTRPFKDRRGAYPVPELIELLHGELPAAIAQLRELQDQLERRVQRASTERRALYGDAITALARVLDMLAPIAAYTVIVPAGGRPERWRGVRRQPRTTASFTGPLIDGRALLLDRDDAAVLQLAPLVQVAAPGPDRELEMFWFDGKGARAARLIAMPAGFERSDPALDDMLRAELGGLDEPATTLEPDSPYRGLAPFTEEFAADYVGREREVEAFVNRLISEPLLAVVGPSGSGKSSFVQAGVLPELPAQWRAIILRPGASPLAALEAHLQAAGVEARGLRDDPGTLAEALRESAAREHATIVLVIDQLEELFTLCKDDRERAAFAAAIADATRTELDPIRVIVTLRDDFLMTAAGMPVLGDRLARGLQLLATPAPDDLERIVLEPARRAGYQFEDPALATEMVDAVVTQAGALALLSFTAAELWKLRDRHFRQLTRKAYVAIGGVAGALAKHAEATLSELSIEDQRLVRIAFRHLVTVDGTRQVLTVDELHQLLAQKARAQHVVDRLIAARLLVASEDTGGVARIEIIHEALLAAWPRLVEWRREDAEGARLRDQLRIAARQWESRGRPRGLLWRDDALAEYRIWRARHPGRMTEVEEAFGRTSLDDERRGRRVRRTLLITAFLVLGGGAAVLFQLRSQAAAQREEAETARKHADEQRGVAEDLTHEMVLVNAESTVEQDPTTALGWLERYPVNAPKWDKVRELAMLAQYRGQARHVLEAHEPKHIVFTLDETRLITAGDQHIQTWDPTSGALLGTIVHHAKLIRDAYGPTLVVLPDGRSVVFTDETGSVLRAELPAGRPKPLLSDRSPRLAVTRDGRYLAAAGARVQIYELATGKVTLLESSTGEIDALVWSADGSRLITAANDGTIRAWDVASRTGRLVHRHATPIYDLDLSPDSAEITFSADDGMYLIQGDLAKPLQLGAFVMAPRFTPDGRSIVALDSLGPKRWSATGASLPLVAAPRAEQLDSGFGASPDLRLVAFSTASGTQLVNLVTGRRRDLVGGRAVLSAAISSTGTRAAVIGGDYLVRIWEVDRGLSVPLEHSLDVIGIAISPDGKTVATGSEDTTVKVTDLATRHSVTLRGHDTGVQTVAFSPDGSKLLAAAFDTTVKVWDLASATATSLPHTGHIAGARFSHDSRRLFTATDDKVRIWELATGDVRVFDYPNIVAFDVSPDETQVVAGTSEGRVVVWDLAAGTPREIGRHDDFIGGVLFLPDGTQIASRGGRDSKRDHSVRLWSTRQGTGRIVIPSRETLRALAVSSKGEIAAGGNDGVVRVVRADGSLQELRGHAKAIRSLAFSPDGALLISSSNDATVRLWRIADGASQIVQRHRGTIRQVTFSRDGRLVGSASDDHTAWVGSVSPERCLGLSPRELSRRIGELTSVRIDRIGVAHLATTPPR